MLVVRFNDDAATRAILLALGGHLVDDVVPFCDGVAEDGDSGGTIPAGVSPEDMAAAAVAANDAILAALGIVEGGSQ